MLKEKFFTDDSLVVARSLIGKDLRRYWEGQWLTATIVETEAYYINEKASHSSLGRTPSRAPRWMNPGTIYMYYARGHDSLNISCKGEGNAVLIKSAFPSCEGEALLTMQKLNRTFDGKKRSVFALCRGQTLLCKSMSIKVKDWSGSQFNEEFFIAETDYKPSKIIQAPRLGIPVARDEHLLYRFIDYSLAKFSTSNPLTRRKWSAGKDYFIVNN